MSNRTDNAILFAKYISVFKTQIQRVYIEIEKDEYSAKVVADNAEVVMSGTINQHTDFLTQYHNSIVDLETNCLFDPQCFSKPMLNLRRIKGSITKELIDAAPNLKSLELTQPRVYHSDVFLRCRNLRKLVIRRIDLATYFIVQLFELNPHLHTLEIYAKSASEVCSILRTIILYCRNLRILVIRENTSLFHSHISEFNMFWWGEFLDICKKLVASCPALASVLFLFARFPPEFANAVSDCFNGCNHVQLITKEDSIEKSDDDDEDE